MTDVLLALLAHRRSEPTNPWEGQGLVGLPCAFSQSLPYVDVDCSDGRGTRRSRLLLDTGANVSFLLGPRSETAAHRVRISGGTGRRVPLGNVTFQPVPKGFFGAEFEAMLRKNGAEGVLGADFAATRDVLVDYGRGSIYATAPKGADDAGPSLPRELGFRRVQAIPFGDRWTAAVTWRREPLGLAFMLVDTGASTTVLPMANGSVPQPPKAEAFTTIGARGLFSGWIEHRRLFVAPMADGFDAEVSFTRAEVDPMLAASSLGDQVLLCFRRNEVWATSRRAAIPAALRPSRG